MVAYIRAILILFAVVFGTLAPVNSEAASVQFIGYAGYSYVGDVAVLTANEVANFSPSGSVSGTLRLELWAFPAPWTSGSSETGYKLAEYTLGQLLGGFNFPNISSGDIPFTPPPNGTWYFVIFVTEYTQASSNDGYSIDDFINALPAPVVFGPQPTDITFGGNNVGYTITGATVALTAATIENLSTNATSGSLRMELWAHAAPYSGTPGTGYKLAEYQLAPLAPGFQDTNVNSGTIAYTPPPDGTWYFVMFLTEYTAASTDDGYSLDDWANFPAPVVIGPPAPGGTTPAVEYYYAAWNFYFVTAIPGEIAALDGGAFGGVWQRTGQQFNVYPIAGAPASSSPVWRFFSTAFTPKSSHFYTADVTQYNVLVNGVIPGWQLEGPVFNMLLPALDGTCPAGSIPVYRMYNNGMGGAPNHRFSTDISVRTQMLAAGWIPEGQGIGVGFCSPQ
jgi:hypothetical protein